MQFDGLPDLIINYDSRCKLPIVTAKYYQANAHQTNLCITDEENQTLLLLKRLLCTGIITLDIKTALQFSNYFVRNLLRHTNLNQQEGVTYLNTKISIY